PVGRHCHLQHDARGYPCWWGSSWRARRRASEVIRSIFPDNYATFADGITRTSLQTNVQCSGYNCRMSSDATSSLWPPPSPAPRYSIPASHTPARTGGSTSTTRTSAPPPTAYGSARTPLPPPDG